MSPKMKTALTDIAAAGTEGAYRRNENWSREAIASRVMAEQPIRAHFRTVVAPALARDAVQDELDRVQAETGIHAECGLPLTDHCIYCDECPRTPGACWCKAKDAIGGSAPMDASGLLSAMISYVADSNPSHVSSVMIHMVMVARGVDETDATEWLAEELQERLIAQAD